MPKILSILVLAILAAILFWFFPLVHIVLTSNTSSVLKASQFSAPALAEKLWHEKLPAALDRAADLPAVLEAIRKNPKQVREQFGRSAGLGRAYLLLVRGNGTVQSVDRNTVTVALDQSTDKPTVVLLTGPLFGNVVRDAASLASASDFANSQQFNDLSTELNRLAENQVIAAFKKEARPGSHIRFVACAEILNESSDFQPLKLIPIDVTFD